MSIKREVINKMINDLSPLYLMDSFDNSGYILDFQKEEYKGIHVSLDLTLKEVETAINNNCDLIISHHPFIFNSIKNIDVNTFTGKIMELCFENKITILALHTPFDKKTLNFYVGEKLGLKNMEVLVPTSEDKLCKLEFYVPKENERVVLDGLFQKGAGTIGNYKNCAFCVHGFGSFEPAAGANPYIGEENKTTVLKEVKVEMVFKRADLDLIIKTLKSLHPYEEVSFGVYEMVNPINISGYGVVGELEKPLKMGEFKDLIKEVFSLEYLEGSFCGNDLIKTVSLVTGSGKSFIDAGIKKGDVYLTGDLGYHEILDGKNLNYNLIDIKHYNSEIFFLDIVKCYLNLN